MPTRSGRMALLALAGLAAGCARQAPTPPPCPRPAILDGAQTLERRTGPGPAELAWRATMTGFSGGCRYDGDGVALQLAIDLAIVPGPGGRGGAPVEVPWFVAVVDPAGTVIDKQTFTLRQEGPLGPGPRLVGERIEQRIQGVTEADGAGWRIYLGLEVDPAEGLERLRARARPGS